MSLQNFLTTLFCGVLALVASVATCTDDVTEEPATTGPKAEIAKKNTFPPLPLPQPRSLAVGKLVPEFWAHTASGQITHISDRWLRKKWVLVEFWSSQDKDRNKTQDDLQVLRTHFLAEDRLVMFSVCVDLDFGDWIKYVGAQKDLVGRNGDRVKFHSDSRWWQLVLGVNDEREIQELIDVYRLKKMPQYFLIGPDETLAVGNIPIDQLQAVLSKHLGQPAK